MSNFYLICRPYAEFIPQPVEQVQENTPQLVEQAKTIAPQLVEQAKTIAPQPVEQAKTIAPQPVEQLQTVTPQVGAIAPQAGEQFLQGLFSIPWGHHRLLIGKFKLQPETAAFYACQTVRNEWSRRGRKRHTPDCRIQKTTYLV